MKKSLQHIKPDCTDFRSVARALTVIENDLEGAELLLKSLVFNKDAPIKIGRAHV